MKGPGTGAGRPAGGSTMEPPRSGMNGAGGRSVIVPPPTEPPPPAPRSLLASLFRSPLPFALLALLVTGVLRLTTSAERATRVALAGLLVAGFPVVWRTVRDALRGHFATDVVASLSIVGALAFTEPVAGLVIVLMQTGGEALERFAERRASAAVRALEAAAPRIAHLLTSETDDLAEDVAVDRIAPGDLLRVRPGELVPVDGVVVSGRSAVDVSTLTGEPVPLAAGPGARLTSGGVNGGGALVIRATATAGESQYARIVRLVRTAQASKAPLQRLADRYAVWFTPATLVVCVIAWLVSGDPTRVLAVLVVATPCPLILATPIAVIGGIDRAARRHVVLRDGGALERLGEADAVVLDKTGTLTLGRPRVRAVRTDDGIPPDEILRLAGAVEEHASHPLARPLVDAARERLGTLPIATAAEEEFGRGIEGTVDGRRVAVGSRAYVAGRHPVGMVEPAADAPIAAWVGIDGTMRGVVEYADEIRPDARRFVADLRARGTRRIVLLSGDAAPNVARAGAALGIDDVAAGLLPEEKERRVRAMGDEGFRVCMIGDGINDAPALAAATVGVALAGASGRGGVTADAADVVVLRDELGVVIEAMEISRRTMRIARQSIRVGLALSAVGMAVAAAGYLRPIAGAVGQELIDVAVILNALRAARG